MFESIVPGLYLLFTILVFPGLLFITALALFTQWWMRKTSARMQRRIGPKYVGPIGILQPLMDLLKLIHVKELVRTKYSMPLLAELFGLSGIAAVITVLAMLPLSPIRFTAPYDFLVFIYFCCIWIPLAQIIMSLSMPGPYTSVGVSRLLSFITVSEPAFFSALLVPVALTSKYGLSYSMYTTATNSWKLWINPYTLPLVLLALIALIVNLQAKAMFQPFNIPEAEQEIIAGYETEFTGPILGLAQLLHDMDIALTAIIITYLVLGGPYPFPHLSIPGIILVIVKYLAVITTAAIIKNVFGRFRIEQALYTIFKYSLIPALIAAVLAMIYLWM